MSRIPDDDPLSALLARFDAVKRESEYIRDQLDQKSYTVWPDGRRCPRLFELPNHSDARHRDATGHGSDG